MKNSESHKKDVWDKAKIVSGLLAALLIPLALGLIGHWSSDAIKSREISLKYSELAIDILRQKPTDSSESLRNWATDILSMHSGVMISEEARNYLQNNELKVQQFLDEKWVPLYTLKMAKNVVKSDKWKELINSNLTEEEQIAYVKVLLEVVYEEIKNKRQELINPYGRH
jgi:hypothetical protein